MAKGTIIQPSVTWEEVLAATNNGYDVFISHLGAVPVSKTFKHPLYNDRQPSAALVCLDGMWFLKDFSGDMPTMTALQFTMRKYGMSRGEAVNKMAMDFGLLRNSNTIYTPVNVTWKAPSVEREECQISFSTKKWKKEHHLFWENTLVDEKHCLKYNTYAVKDAAIHRKRVYIGEKEVVWAYYSEILDKVKLYFPEREKGNRFKGNITGNYIWNLKNIESCKNLLVQKSMKDLLISTLYTPCVIATQTESHKIFTDEVVENIHRLSKRVIIAYGSDVQGVKESTELSKKYGWEWCNPRKESLPEVNDFYSLAKKYGIKEVEKLLKSKNII